MTGRTRTHQLVALATVVVLAGCGATAEGTKAGGQAAPVILRIGTDDSPGRPAAAQIGEFVRQVEELSDGGVRIEPEWNALGDSGDDDWDQKVARMVVAGEVDMGLIPTRAWDTEGVTSLRALNAPFLITSDELAAEVASSELAATMLADLATVGVTGLALWPEGLRHVFGFADPLLAPGDFTGQLIRVPASDTAYATFAALGASSDDVTAGDDDVVAGEVAGAESSFAWAATLPRPATGVGNLTLYPKYNSLVINNSVWNGLPIEQQAVLRDAAKRTLGWAIDHVPDEATAATEFCQRGGRVVNTDDANVKAFRDAVQPVYAQLEQDPTTRTLIEAIRALKGSTGAEAALITPCDPTQRAATSDPGSPTTEAFPEGVYRAEVPLQGLLDAGIDPADANNIAGLFTLTFADGHLTVHDVNNRTGRENTDTGTYCVEDGRLSLGLAAFAEPGTDDPCGSFWSAGWTLAGDQLRLVEITTTQGSFPAVEGTIFGGQPFTKIG